MASVIWNSGQAHRRIGEELNQFCIKTENQIKVHFIILMKNCGIC